MIQVGAPVIAESSDQLTLRYGLKAPAWVGLRRDELTLTYPLHCRSLYGLGEVALMSLLPYAFLAGAHIRLDSALTLGSDARESVARLCQLWGRWYHRPFTVQVEGGGTESRAVEYPGKTALLFSGGVDSMAVYLRHKTEINRLIFVNGTDLHFRGQGLHLEQDYRVIESALRQFSDREGKAFDVVSTNVRDVFAFRRTGDVWYAIAHGCGTAAPVLALSPDVSRLLFASSGLGKYEFLVPSGTHPDVVPLLGAGRISVVIGDVEWTKHRRDRLIARDSGAVSVLRVCPQSSPDYNCGQCSKCCRTIAGLVLAGVRPGEAPFPPGTFCLEHVVDRVRYIQFNFHLRVRWSEILTALHASQEITPAGRHLAEILAQQLGPFYERYLRDELPAPSDQLADDLPPRPNALQRWAGYSPLSQASFTKWLKSRARARFGKKRLQTLLRGNRPTDAAESQ